MDVIDQLFHELPPPCQHHAHPGSTELVAKCNMALEKFVEGAYLRPSTQSHFEFLKRIAVNAIRNSYFWDLQDQLGKLALEQPRVMDGDSMRANYFRYCHWLIMGRRDAEQALWSQAISQHTDTVEMTTETQNEETMAIAKPLSLFQALFVEVLLATLEEELIFLRTTSTRITAHFVHPGTDQSNGRCLVRDSWLRGTPLDSARLAVLTAGCCGEVLTTTKPLFDLLLGRKYTIPCPPHAACYLANHRTSLLQVGGRNRHAAAKRQPPCSAGVSGKDRLCHADQSLRPPSHDTFRDADRHRLHRRTVWLARDIHAVG